MANKSPLQKELERRANDLIRVYNPTEKDYVVEWDRRDGVKLFRVVAKSEAVLMRYLAEKYLREMYQKIVDEKIIMAVNEENKKRSEKGMPIMDKTSKTNEQMMFEENNIPDDAEARNIMATLWVGIESEYGIDTVPEVEPTPGQGEKTQFQRVFENLEKAVEEDPKRGDSVYRCEYPGCNFSTDVKLALIGHKRSHRDKKNEAVSEVSA